MTDVVVVGTIKFWFHYGRMIYVVIVVTNKLDRNGSATAFHDGLCPFRLKPFRLIAISPKNLCHFA
jgi:hypothetical protein